jgi:hypothetical protein
MLQAGITHMAAPPTLPDTGKEAAKDPQFR